MRAFWCAIWMAVAWIMLSGMTYGMDGGTVEENSHNDEGNWSPKMLEKLDECHVQWLDLLLRNQSGIIIECLFITTKPEGMRTDALGIETLQMAKTELDRCGSGGLFTGNWPALCRLTLDLLSEYYHISSAHRSSKREGVEYWPHFDDDDDI